jgi:peroxiredoxin
MKPFTVIAGIFMFALLLSSAEATDLKIGERAPGFVLPGVDGEFHSLDSLAGEKGTIVVFTCNHCPFAKSYQGRIKDIARDYKNKGINLVAINPNDAEEYPDDSYANMIKRAKTKKYNFPYLRDRTQKTAVKYGAVVTPHIFLLDSKKRLYFRGPIDDSWRDPDKVENRYLREAIDAMLAGEKLVNDKRRAMGCSIKWLKARGKDVTPYEVAADAQSIKPLEKGKTVPDAILSDRKGKVTWLSDVTKGQRTAIIFFRGGWCPYCRKHLKDLNTIHDDLVSLGFKIVGVTPDTPDAALGKVADLGLDYTVLSDPAMEATMAFGLAFTLSPETVEKYRDLNVPMRSAPGLKAPVLPVPAAYLVDSKGTVRFRHINPDYTERINAEAFLDAAREIESRSGSAN